MDIDPPPPTNTPDAPDKEKMDQIRRRRLEKLSGAVTPKQNKPADPANTASSSYSTPTPTSAENVESTPRPRINITNTPTPPTTSTPENPSTRSTARPSSATGTSTVRTPANQTLKRPRAESDVQTTPRPTPRRPAPIPADEPIQNYENRILGQIFRVTLNPNEKVDASNHRLIYLPGHRQELEEEDAPLLLTKDRLDSIILEAGSTVPHSKSVLDYLLPCWKRITKVQKGLRGYANEKDAIIKEAKRLCMSYCVFAVEMPDFFGREPNPATDTLTPYLLNEASEEKGICPDFLTEAVARISEDDTIMPMLTKAVSGLSYQLSNMTMNDNYKPYVHALKSISLFPPLVAAIAEDPLFQMATSAPGIEKHTLLGPFFRISPLQPEVTKEYFSTPKTLDKRIIATSQEALRLTLQSHQRDLLDIINCFIRASPKSREKTLDWFAYIVNQNHKRRAMRPDPATLSSDGFLLNVTVILDGLCEPFMDSTFSKVSKIDFEYLRRKPRVEISEETKLNADQSSSDAYYAIEVEGTSNFISEIFFLTLAAHHYGTEGTGSTLKGLDKDIKYLKGKLEEIEAERPKFANSPVNLARFEASLARYNDVLEKAMSFKFAIEGVIFDKQMQTKSLQFMRYVTVWILRTATGTDYTPEKTIQLPLTGGIPDSFRNLPEYAIEGILSNFKFIFQYLPDIMISAVGEEVIALCITFLSHSEYIKNPYLKAKLVSLLFHGSWPIYHRIKGVIGDSLTGTKFSNDHLLHALMKFYIEVEQTGAHTQFYDKFNIRYEIFQVIKCIWTNTMYREQLQKESKTNTQFFLRFVNLLLNDATYVLDEALTKFPKIHDLQKELRQIPSTLTQEQREAKDSELQAAETQAKSYMDLTNETVSMMKLFTETLVGSFTMPEIVDRVAAMLDYTLNTLVGPKSADLKVENPEKYHFNAKTLLSEFVDIYLNLGVSSTFVEAVARDGRSYSEQNFISAIRILTRFSLKSSEDIDKFDILKNKFKAAKEADDQDEDDLGEYPDEYTDPIMATLMLDPVMLPSSKQIVDRSTIQGHLLSDPLDPFNRQPLKIEEVIEQPDLKAQVSTWREEMRAKAKLGRSNAMDTS